MTALSELVDRLTPAPPLPVVWATVASRTTGPPATVSLYVSGSTVATAGARFLQSAETGGALTAGDVVVVLRNGRDLIVLGRLS